MRPGGPSQSGGTGNVVPGLELHWLFVAAKPSFFLRPPLLLFSSFVVEHGIGLLEC